MPTSLAASWRSGWNRPTRGPATSPRSVRWLYGAPWPRWSRPECSCRARGQGVSSCRRSTCKQRRRPQRRAPSSLGDGSKPRRRTTTFGPKRRRGTTTIAGNVGVARPVRPVNPQVRAPALSSFFNGRTEWEDRARRYRRDNGLAGAPPPAGPGATAGTTGSRGVRPRQGQALPQGQRARGGSAPGRARDTGQRTAPRPTGTAPVRTTTPTPATNAGSIERTAQWLRTPRPPSPPPPI
jgi:hypothetical protein